MVALLLLVACDGGPASPSDAAPVDAAGAPRPAAPGRPSGPHGPAGPPRPPGPPGAGQHAPPADAFGAGAVWAGEWTVTVHALPDADAGAAALAEALALPLQPWGGGLEPQAGHAHVLWLSAEGLDKEGAGRLAPRPDARGELVVALAPAPEATRAAATEALLKAGVGVVDPTASVALWVDSPSLLEPALAGRVAARVVADHYVVAYRGAPGALPAGLEAALGPWTEAQLAAPDARTRAEAVRRAPDGAPLDTLASDPSYAVRLAVATRTASHTVRAALAADRDPQVRVRAADRLDDVPVLARLAADDPSSVVRLVATHRLAELAQSRPTDVAPALRAAVSSTDAYQRWKAAWGLGRVPGATDALLPLLRDPDIDVRREAARSLGRLGDPAAVPALLEALRDDNSFVRRWAGGALGEIGDARARDALRAAAADPTVLVAQSAARALGRLGESSNWPPFKPPSRPADDAALEALLTNADATVRKDAAKFLAERADGERLARLAADRDSEVRKGAVDAMGANSATASGALAFLSDPDPDVRVTALDALRRGRAGDPARIAALLADPDAEMHLRAAEALAALGPSDALTALARDPDERVRAAVVAVRPELCDDDEPAALVRRAAGRADADPAVAPPPSHAAWAAGVMAREDDLLHHRFSWHTLRDQPAVHRRPRPPVIRGYGHPDRG